MWTTPFLSVFLQYLISDGSDVAEVAHERIHDHGDVHGVQIRSAGKRFRDSVFGCTNLVGDNALFYHPVATEFFTKVAAQAELVEPLEDPTDHGPDVGVTDHCRNLER